MARKIYKRSIAELGYNFIDPKYIHQGKDEYHLRDGRLSDKIHYRKLSASEIEILVKNQNTSDDWSNIWVTDEFDPQLVLRCQFFGKVRIGALGHYLLEHHNLRLPVGLRDSTIVSCDIGDHVVISNVQYLSHYQIDDEVMLVNIDEMITTDCAKFGSGILKEGEEASNRIWLEIRNENGGRKVLPFENMCTADAQLWSDNIGDKDLTDRFVQMVDNSSDHRRGQYGWIGNNSIIKNCSIIKDVHIGSHAYIKGGNKLKNLKIFSNQKSSTQIGEGCELVNGIIGYGCRIFYGVKAVRFIMADNSVLKYGARLINSFLGANSTISCCEVLNSLIFPSHEQHHNNSFLCAAMVGGQSNIAAGATIGSNHNSRANDGEVVIGRGFWPALSMSLKHNTKIASFCLLAKGDFPAEMNIPFPFALVNNNVTTDQLEIMPGYWYMYNLYALSRNERKFDKRDKRNRKYLYFEYNFLAPDTIQEICTALELISKHYLDVQGKLSKNALKEAFQLIQQDTREDFDLNISDGQFENSKRNVILLKAKKGYMAYVELLTLYAVYQVTKYASEQDLMSFSGFESTFKARKCQEWTNLGTQMVKTKDVNHLLNNIRTGKITVWSQVHEMYKKFAQKYDKEIAQNGFEALCFLADLKGENLSESFWKTEVKNAISILKKMSANVLSSREKDYNNFFRMMVYKDENQRDAVIGSLKDNQAIKDITRENAAKIKMLKKYL